MNKILLAVDGSETSMKASEETLKIAKALNAEVILLSVVYNHPVYTTPEGMSRREFTQMLEKSLQCQVASFETFISSVKKKFEEASITVSSKIIIGRPSNEIIKEVSKEDYSLVVLGSRGLKGIRKLLLGTVSDKVAQNVNCSVFIVK